MSDTHETRFCDDCGARLRSWDFLKERAVISGGRAFCLTCRPSGTPVTPPLPEARGETRWRTRRNRQVL
jgi:hypothetical protein